MPRQISSITRLILERTAIESQTVEQSQHPTVLSCGGMYLPRTKSALPTPVCYHVLNLPNENEPIKIYVGRRHLTNLLHQILAKEGMN